jgi:cell division protein FtsB
MTNFWASIIIANIYIAFDRPFIGAFWVALALYYYYVKLWEQKKMEKDLRQHFDDLQASIDEMKKNTTSDNDGNHTVC